MKIYSDRVLLFRTKPMLNDFMFRKVCNRFLEDYMFDKAMEED